MLQDGKENSRAVICLKFMIPKRAVMVSAPDLGNLLHLPRRQRESQHPQIVAHALLLARRGDGHNVLIHAPAQQDLVGADVVLPREAGEVVGQRTLGGSGGRGEGPVGGQGDVVLAVEGDQVVAVLEVGVEFDLVDGGGVERGGQGGFQVALCVVGDADGSRFARLLHRFHLGPFLLEVGVGLGEEGGVDEVEVDVFEAELLEAGVDGRGDGGDVGDYFGGDEELFAGDLAGGDGGAEFGFGVVDFGAVEVDVAELGGFGGCGYEGFV